MTLRPFRRAALAVHRSRSATLAARGGLLARAAFYLLLAYLVLRVLTSGDGPQTNASGALATVSAAPGGRVAVALAAVGFLAFGGSRLLGALRDRDVGRLARFSTGLQGLFYLALTEVPLSFVLGSRSTGSEQQTRSTTALVLGLPAGRVLVFAAGVLFVVVCGWQVVTALRAGFMHSLRLGGSPRWLPWLVRLTGQTGIITRALVFLPLGLFLMLAAVHAQAARVKGLDAALGTLRSDPAGRWLLAAIAAGFVVFAAYSVLEARYRDVDAGN